MDSQHSTTHWDEAAQERIVKRFKWLVYESSYHTSLKEFCRLWGVDASQLRRWGLKHLKFSSAEWKKMVRHNNRSATFRRMKKRMKSIEEAYADEC